MEIGFLENLLAPWAYDAVVDSVKTIPFLFFVFLFIEIFEHFQANKIKNFLSKSQKTGPLIGSIAASIPQCGFSVVASTLYCEKFITKGTIIAVYLATSDEAIPVLLMYPKFLPYILPLILIKLLIAIPIGYFVDLFFKTNLKKDENEEEGHIEGCCRHDITIHKKRDFLIHPIKHTLGIFVFILVITLILNYFFEVYEIEEIFKNGFAPFMPLFASIFGLIPNCAVSVGLVLMFVKGIISFGALISGLLTSGGIGLLVLFKKNNLKDTFLILLFLVLTGYVSGLLIQTFVG